MSNRKDIEKRVESFIEEQKNISPNPFLSIRVMALINNDKKERERLSPAWQGFAIALSLIVAMVMGIKAGNLYKPSALNDDKATVMFMSDDEMEHFAFYQQKSNE